MQQLALPQPPQLADPSVVPISGLQEVTIAMIGAAQQLTEDNKRVSLLIDSSAATHVCPPWFAPQSPLHQLEHGTGPQLRTVTNQHIKLFGNRWVCVTNRSGQQFVIPFYVCEVKQPILSVTRLVEQGFQLTLDDNPRLQHIKGFNSTLENRNGLFFLQAEIATLPKGTKRQTHRTRTDWHDSTDHNYTTRSCRYRIRRRLLAVQHNRRTCQSTQATHEDTLHTIKNTVWQSQQNNLRTTGEQPSGSRMVQLTRLRTSVKQWKSQTKHNSKCGKEKQHSGSRKAQRGGGSASSDTKRQS